MDSEEASSLGAGISAAVASGWYSSFEEAVKAMTHVNGITEPIPQNIKLYQDLKTIYKDIYPLTQGIYKKMKSL